MNVIRKIIHTKFFSGVNRLVLSIFYKKKFLRGKHFDESRFGFVWAWRGIFHSFKMRRRGIRFPISKLTRLSNGKNLEFDVSSLNVFQQPGCFFQNQYHWGRNFSEQTGRTPGHILCRAAIFCVKQKASLCTREPFE